MPPKFPLQARFAACLSTIILLIVLYFILSSPRFAYAVDVDSIIREDHNHRVIRDSNVQFSKPRIAGHVEMLTDNVTGHAVLARRAPEGVDSLTNNVPKLKNIQMGETHHWVIPKSVVTGPKSPVPPGLPKTVEIKEVQPKPSLDEESMQEQRKRNEEVSRRTSTVYVTLNTCIQPILNATQRADDSSPPQLQLFYSQDGSVKEPGPNTPNILSVNFDDGYASVEINAAGDVYIGVFAPTHPRYGGIYNYEVAASIDAPFHSAEQNTPFLYFVDSDSNAALLQTNNLTSASAGESSYEEWMNLDPPPFTLFAHNMNHSAILGIQKSFCGLSKNAQINRMGGSLQVKMSNRSMHPREQFYITNLNRTSSYYGIIAMEGNSTASGSGVVGGGGKVWKAMNFTTKSENNCALAFDLDFCSGVAYAVPSNPSFKRADLEKIYDNHAASLYKNFTYSLQQIPCNTSASSKYSLARGCDDCAAAYKHWLCAVTIPRCHDFSSGLPFLKSRNTGQTFLNGSSLPEDFPGRQVVASNSSRNDLIDNEIRPGPYKEVLPCINVCHQLAQSCPRALGFVCPSDTWQLESYGNLGDSGDVTCSYLGAAYSLRNDASKLSAMHMGMGSAVLGFWHLVWWLGG